MAKIIHLKRLYPRPLFYCIQKSDSGTWENKGEKLPWAWIIYEKKTNSLVFMIDKWALWIGWNYAGLEDD